MSSGFPRTTILLILGSILMGGIHVSAQEAETSVRLVIAKATGKRKKKDKPALPPQLKPYRKTLQKLTYDRYEAKGKKVKRAAQNTPMAFDKLALKYQVEVSWTKKKKKMEVAVEVTKPAVPPKKGRVKVASIKVRVRDGQHFVIKCVDAYPDGDLLLLVTASSKRLAETY